MSLPPDIGDASWRLSKRGWRTLRRGSPCVIKASPIRPPRRDVGLRIPTRDTLQQREKLRHTGLAGLLVTFGLSLILAQSVAAKWNGKAERGSSPDQALHVLRGGAPDPCRIVQGRGHHPGAIRAEGGGRNLSRVARQDGDCLAGGGVPNPRRPVLRCGHHPGAVWAEGSGLDPVRVPYEGGDRFAGGDCSPPDRLLRGSGEYFGS